MARATYYCVDIECSGPVPSMYDMISLGAVPVHWTSGRYVVGEERFYAEMKPESDEVDAGAMAVNGLDIHALRATGQQRSAALRDLTAFVERTLDPGSRPVFVGHNAPFDWSFVCWSYKADGLVNPFGYKALDTKALAMGVLGLHWFDANKERLAEALTLPNVTQELVHRADYDAWYQAHILVALLQQGRFEERTGCDG